MTGRNAKVILGSWPTPLEPAPRLAVAIGLRPEDLWIKRDDLTGLGGGGNKVRKLEYTCAAALDSGAKALVTIGAAQSNHARLTAAAGARLGLAVVLILAGVAPKTITGNVGLNHLFGAGMVWAGDVDEKKLQYIAKQQVASLAERGVHAALIPLGGSSILAAQGYVDCGHELLEQSPDLQHVVIAVGSGGTMAGLVSALGASRVYGVNVGAIEDPRGRVGEIVEGLCAAESRSSLRIRPDQVGAGYSHMTDHVEEAMRTAARTEGIVLDPIYTGRALAGLIAAVREGEIRPGERTVFLHSGGMPGLFGHADALKQLATSISREIFITT
jgi:L-cysteate sulfo-lyase